MEVETYIVAGLDDHIVPWQNAYRSTQLLGGPVRFVLSTSGHIQAPINPPRAGSESRSSYRIADEHPPDSEPWLQNATTKPGSW